MDGERKYVREGIRVVYANGDIDTKSERQDAISKRCWCEAYIAHDDKNNISNTKFWYKRSNDGGGKKRWRSSIDSWMSEKLLNRKQIVAFFSGSKFDRVPRLSRFLSITNHLMMLVEGEKKAIFMFESIELSTARILSRTKKSEAGCRMKNDVATIAFLLFGSREIANEKSCHERIYRGFMIEWISQQIAFRRLTRCLDLNDILPWTPSRFDLLYCWTCSPEERKNSARDRRLLM